MAREPGQWNGGLQCWLNYDLTQAVSFLRAGGWRLRAHVLVIGPLAFCVLWKYRPEER